jgi:hypothetical protein
MTVVPLSFQLCGWIPAWWRGAAGGDDLLELVGTPALAALADVRTSVSAVTAFSPELGVGALPGPRRVTETAVAAGQAVILHRGRGSRSLLLIPGGDGWSLLEGDVPRPVDLDLRQAAAEFAEAVVTAEHALRETGRTYGAEVPSMSVRPLPPGADPHRRGLLVRAVRVWSAVAAVPPAERTPDLAAVITASARATLAAYAEPVVSSASRSRRFA